jgi:hypothetical protein
MIIGYVSLHVEFRDMNCYLLKLRFYLFDLFDNFGLVGLIPIDLIWFGSVLFGLFCYVRFCLNLFGERKLAI